LLALFATQPLAAQETHEVQPKPFQVYENVTATVEARSMAPITPGTENWTTLKIEEIVAEGSTVEEGDPIARFETKELEQKIRESEQAVALGRLTIETSRLELEQLKQTLSLDQAMADRKLRIAEQDYLYFTEVDRPNREKRARRGVENSQFQLEYAQEEYNQLKRMYDEDELTEESEEIVLKRTQRDVENSQFFLEQEQLEAAHHLDVELPRELEQKTDELERARLEHERAQITLPLERDQKQVALEKATLDFEKQQLDLQRLKDDLQKLVITSPAKGVVYYGRCVRGAWMGATGPQRDLEIGRTVPHDKPLVTIVDPSDLFLRADLTEKQLAALAEGAEGVARPVAFRDASLPVVVAAISRVPVQTDKYDCQMRMSEAMEGLMPGMTCQVRFLVHQNETALLVPETAVFTDDGVTHYVFVPGEGEGAAPERRNVTVGLTSEKMTEVTEGLSAGDKVLLKRPE
jgi:multidrug efflux pump subunit AcrA (membrane-fusion protein)